VKTATIAAAVSLTALVGCGSGDRPATWSYISPALFQPNCATSSCHSQAAAAGGVDFSDPDRGYTSLTKLWVWVVNPKMDGGAGCGTVNGTPVCEEQFRPLVIPYDPFESRLVNMLRARNAPRMPPDRPLTEEDIRLVETWILNGASKTSTPPAPAMDAAADAAGDSASHPDAVGDSSSSDAASDTSPDTSGDASSTDGAGPGATDGATDAVGQ
jgi:hypothetical protein